MVRSCVALNHSNNHLYPCGNLNKVSSAGVIFISGDVHYSEISKLQPEALYPLYDVTSSGITQVWADIEQNRNRVGSAHSRNNFGMLEVEWGGSGEGSIMDTAVRMVVRDADDQVLTNHTVLLSQLSL